MIVSKGIRGAITVEENSEEAIKLATLELLENLVKKNNLNKNDISHVIFSLTKDLNKAFPAKFARLNFGWDFVPMMCFNEAEIENALSMCIRILIVINCDKNFSPEFVYLKGAKNLRK